ncbi:MAG: hypothetical protein WD059_05425 [Balneolaceae bacterium]
MKKTIVFGLLIAVITGCSDKETVSIKSTNNTFALEGDLESVLGQYVNDISFDSLSIYDPEITYTEVSDGITKISMSWNIDDTLKQDDWQLTFKPAFTPDFHWAPHLTPTEDYIIGQHAFRAPAMIVASESEKKQFAIIPDLDVMKKGSPVQWYMDLNAPENSMTLGLSNQRRLNHIFWQKHEGAIYPPGEFEFGFYIMSLSEVEDLFNPWRKPLQFFWDRWGKPLYNDGQPMDGDQEHYVEHTYNWAFNTWKENVWQEFTLDGKKVGAPTFIVNVTQSPNYPGVVDEREFRSVWNQAWFSSLRSAQGVFRYARRTGNDDLLEKARMTKELALSFPQEKGFFPSVIGTGMEQVEVDGEEKRRSTGWENYFFGNSNRNPYSRQPESAPYHILDMSWTAYLMLTWYEELEQDERLLEYATEFANSLVEIQDSSGFFPGWLDDSLKPMQHLNNSPESSMSVTFLLKLYEHTGNKKYFDSAIKAIDAVIEDIIPIGRWEDFETYWSCNPFGSRDLVNKKIERNNMFKQNNFSMYWTSQALLNVYHQTGNDRYLEYGQRTLDELLMTQATWQPPYMYVNTLGGFGVMNADGEWNDSRQSLFSELIVQYGEVMDNEEYIERGLAALRASFTMMYAPENPKTKEQWERKWPFFSEEDYGFMMENYAHGGTTSPDGVGIGTFTIYDWGNGAASEGYNRMIDHYGVDFIHNR